MAVKCQCKHCLKKFIPRPQNPNQQYCSDPACQKARKREWQKKKLKNDSEYRANQQDAQRRWRKKHPDYWRKYRKRNTEYTKRNREQQQSRNRRKHVQGGRASSIVKMDASIEEISVTPGRYELRRIEDGHIAKMDVSIVEINVISGRCP